MDKSIFIDKIKDFEGFRSKAYLCPSGVLTIGYGHTHGVVRDMVVTESIASDFLQYDLDIVFLQLNVCHEHFANIPLGVRFALVDFVFNVGISKYRNSTLCKIVEKLSHVKDFDDVCRLCISVELQKWCYAKGKRLHGLEKRRNWECELLYVV